MDIVFLGDGYTQELLGLYHSHVDSAVARLFATTPFKQYQSYFNVHRVDVVSNEEGVDNAPVFGVQKDTAMHMQYWCAGAGDRRLAQFWYRDPAGGSTGLNLSDALDLRLCP